MRGRTDRQAKRIHLRVALCVAMGVGTLALILPGPASGVGRILDTQAALDDFDSRTGSVAPSSAAQLIVQNLGATVRWNRFGTPLSLIKYGGYLATGLSGSDAVSVARSWIVANKALFRLTSVTSTNLQLLNDSLMTGSDGHAVVFRQHFGDLAAAQDGMITIGITGTQAAGWKIAYVSSSAVGTQAPPTSGTLTATAAWLNAAADIGRPASAADISNVRKENGWTLFDVEGFAPPQIKGHPVSQRSRLVALPTPTDGVKATYETVILHVQGGEAVSYTHFVDARSGQVLFRRNNVDQLASAGPTTGTFQGSTAANPPCGPKHDFDVPAGTKSIDVVASAENPVEDIVLNLYDPSDTQVASSDTGTSPEAIHYAPPVLPPGTYAAEVCQFDLAAPPFGYVGSYFTQDVASAGFPYPPKWKVFPANPPLSLADTDTRKVWCWVSSVDGVQVPDCQPIAGTTDKDLFNLAARAPWDHDVRTGVPTFTTKGNQAISGEAWLSPLTPAEQYRPVDLNREYIFPWTDQWNDEKCSPTVFATPERNDIDAATVNLFAMHNRMHDWSYFLGFTEVNYNMQDSNFGNGAPGPYPLGREADPEIGNSQAGAIDGGFPTFQGRDNANQITLNDGIPGITNMYLWQPIAGGFYPPCVDGDYDMSVIGHEYTHAISNRMVGGPDAGLTSSLDGQARAMGESWSDVTAVEYLNEYKYVPTGGENPFSVGTYVTGNKLTGIRNYNMSASPLNFSDVQGYDGMGSGSPHDDGEIWSAVNYDIRQSLNTKYNGQYPASNAALQRQCADGELPANQCPGNRRWMQIVFDAYLLMPPNVDMLVARDAYLAADQMRFGGANKIQLWKSFAKRGMGDFASTAGTDDPQPIPNFESRVESNEATVTFVARAADVPGSPDVPAEIYAGKYEANVTPIADTDPATPRSATAKFVPGTYEFLVRANGRGMTRFTMTLSASQVITRYVHLTTNHASKYNGAVATGDGVNHDALIDDTESTNWAALNRPGTNTTGTQVTVDLAGTQPVDVRSVRVSALLRAADAGNEQDPGSQNRFTALRSFEIYGCNNTVPLDGNCSLPTQFHKLGTYIDGFPSGVPRPLAPDLILRSFDVADTQATHVRLVVLDNQCTGGPAYQGEQDNDPLNVTDCELASAASNDVRAAELEVFSFDGQVRPPGDPVVTLTMTAPATAAQNTNVGYSIGYTNLGPEPAANAKITDVLPSELTFVSASNGGTYNAATRTVTWSLGTVPVNVPGSVTLTATVNGTVPDGTAIFNQATFTATDTFSIPAAAVTVVI
ncbi:hypothetical protein BH20ACT24_BH20ACT24_14740 [soil metagenome]